MHVTMNGRSLEIEDGMTMVEALQGQGIDPATVIVEHNRSIVAASEWPTLVLADGDEIEVMRFVGGG